MSLETLSRPTVATLEDADTLDNKRSYIPHALETKGETYEAFVTAMRNYNAAQSPAIKDIFKEEVAETACEVAVQVLPEEVCQSLNIDPQIIEDITLHHQATESDVIILAKASQVTGSPTIEGALLSTIDTLLDEDIAAKIRLAVESAVSHDESIAEAIIKTIDTETKRHDDPLVYLRMAKSAITTSIDYNSLQLNDEALEILVKPEELIRAHWNNSRELDGNKMPIVPNAGNMPVVVFEKPYYT